jgi:serine/threonine-protein kinase
LSEASKNLPERLGPYRIVEEVGAGGLGRVFRAIDERTGNTVAVKVLHDKYTHNRKFLGIFHRELLIMAGMHHKHIVGYLDSYFEPPNCYIVTEFVEGWSGHYFLKQVGRVPPLVALSIVIDMMKGIDHLHLHDTIHSDLSASNILIDRSGRVMVTDFGLSCQMDVEDYKNYMIGTPGYYSPEHISEAAICPQTDIYCAGLILYEMITGRKAVPASTDRNKTLTAMKRISFDKLHISDKAMNAMVAKLLRQCLQFQASKRLQTAEHLMFGCYEILRRFHIRYARHAIKKFLIDKNVVKGPFSGNDQEIYLGAGE